MGWFGFGSSSTPSSSSSSSEGIAPNRLQRARCWEARDGFFQCLDRNNISDPIKEAPVAHASCGIQEVAFEKECVGSWVCPDCLIWQLERLLIGLQVEYFKKRRVMERKRETMLKKLEEEGAKPIQMPNPVGNAQKEP